METQEEYRARLKEIASYAFMYGVDAMIEAGQELNFATWSKETNLTFIIKCQDGFKLAQKRLIAGFLYYHQQRQDNDAQLKIYQTQHLKQELKDAKYQQAVITQRLHTLSHIADSIAWQILRGQIHLVRRLVIHGDTTKVLTSSNLRHATEVADKINENPLDFALITDITGYIGIGDLLIKHLTSVGIMELKEGRINDQIAEFFAQLERDNKKVEETDLSAHFDPTTVKQARRMLRQQKRMTQAVQVMNTDTGIDPATQKPIIVSTPTSITEYYYDELIELQEQLKTQVWAYTLIEGCLHIGMYRDEGLARGPQILKLLVEEKTKNFILIDWLAITREVSEPLFAKPLDPDLIIDILTGRVKVIMGLDLDGLIEAFNITGLPTRWMSTKETAKQASIHDSKTLVRSHNQAITWDNPNDEKEGKGVMGQGVISKILYDNIKPTSMALSFLTAEKPPTGPAE
ncbi:MAG: hypothetical protein ACRYFZ_19545 [Janthinobacterium lividum]